MCVWHLYNISIISVGRAVLVVLCWIWGLFQYGRESNMIFFFKFLSCTRHSIFTHQWDRYVTISWWHTSAPTWRWPWKRMSRVSVDKAKDLKIYLAICKPREWVALRESDLCKSLLKIVLYVSNLKSNHTIFKGWITVICDTCYMLVVINTWTPEKGIVLQS